MNISVKELARLVNGKIFGDENLTINNVARIDQAGNGDLTFLYLPAFEKYFESTKASAIIVKPGFKRTRNDLTYIEAEQPDKAFGKILIRYFTPEFSLSGIDKSSSVDKSSKLGKNTAVGKNVVIAGGCTIGNNVKIFHNTVISANVEIGDNSIIFQNVSIREGSKLGKNVIIHAGCVIGSDGFGFNPDENGVYQKIPQIGNVIIKDNVEIGSNSTIDRAALGSTVIHKGVKIDNLVQIAHNVSVGENTVISSQVGISGSTTIGKQCIIAGQVGIAGHLTIGDKVVLLAQSGVSKSLLKPGYYFGYPAKEMKVSHKLEAHIRNLPEYSEKIKLLEKELQNIKKQLPEKSI